MAFILDAKELKPGLVIFRRADVKHRNWYCRVKLPNADRYKTVSLKTADIDAAKERAFDEDADLRFRIKHDVPVFNRPFSQIAKEYVEFQKERFEAGQIGRDRWKNTESVIRAQLNPYVGSVQITLIGQDRWDGYPLWRQKNGKGLDGRVSDASIRYEMVIFRAIMVYAASKKYITERQIFKGKLALAKVRREEFTPEEYRKLHTFARGWINRARAPCSHLVSHRHLQFHSDHVQHRHAPAGGQEPPLARCRHQNRRSRPQIRRPAGAGQGASSATWWRPATSPTTSTASAPSARRPGRTISCSRPGDGKQPPPSMRR